MLMLMHLTEALFNLLQFCGLVKYTSVYTLKMKRQNLLLPIFYTLVSTSK